MMSGGKRLKLTLKVVASSIRKDLLMSKTCGLCLEISQVMVLTVAINVDDIEDLDLDDNGEQASQATPTSSKVRLGVIIPEKNKKPKTAQVMCEQVTRIGDIAEASHSSF